MAPRSKTPKRRKSASGSVVVVSSHGRLQLRFMYQGKRRLLSLGLADTPEHRKIAEAKAALIQADIVLERLDESLDRYCPPSKIKPKPLKLEPDLGQIWSQFEKFRSAHLEETTVRTNYGRVRGHLEKLPTLELSKVHEIWLHLMGNNSPETAKRILMFFSCACDWAVDSRLIEKNPFTGMSAKIKVKGGASKNIDPFTTREKDEIIQAFENHPTYKHYAPFVRFLFLTGCRTSEAIGLRSCHVASDLSSIRFCEAVVTVSSHKIRKGTKTKKPRTFKCNTALKNLLASLDLTQDIVFPSLGGKVINSHTFNAWCWKGCKSHGVFRPGIVYTLALEGKIERYRPQYNTRHTAITHWLDQGVPVHQVAAWVGNSPEVIYRHYCGLVQNLIPPEY